MRTHNTRAFVALTLAGSLAVAACNFDITNPNSPPSIGSNATRAQVDAAVVGLLVALRADYANWVLKAAILGREGYRLDTAHPRVTTQLLAGALDARDNAA